MPARAMELRRSDALTAPAWHERCQDSNGNRYVVAAWPDARGATRYELLDGTGVRKIDRETFELPGGVRLRRDEDAPFAHWA